MSGEGHGSLFLSPGQLTSGFAIQSEESTEEEQARVMGQGRRVPNHRVRQMTACRSFSLRAKTQEEVWVETRLFFFYGEGWAEGEGHRESQAGLHDPEIVP